MRLRISSDHTAAARLQHHASSTVPHARRSLADRLRKQALARLTAETPVRTGRLRRAWQDAAAGQGADAASTDRDSPGQSQRAAHNSVPYGRYVEYGTSRQQPRRLMRRALRHAARMVRSLFRLS